MWLTNLIYLTCGTLAIWVLHEGIHSFLRKRQSFLFIAFLSYGMGIGILNLFLVFGLFKFLPHYFLIGFKCSQILLIPLLYVHLKKKKGKLKGLGDNLKIDLFHFYIPLGLLLLLTFITYIDLGGHERSFYYTMFVLMGLYIVVYGYFILRQLDNLLSLSKLDWNRALSGDSIVFWEVYLVLFLGLLYFKELVVGGYINLVCLSCGVWEFQWVNSILWITAFVFILRNRHIFSEHCIGKNHRMRIGLASPDSFWIPKNIKRINNKQDRALQDRIRPRLSEYIAMLGQYFSTTTDFRNPDIKLNDIAHQLGMPLSHLVYLLKYHCTLSFTELKHLVQIRDALAYIQNGYLSSNTLESLALDVGYKSYNPFFSSFKNLLKVSPNEYASYVESNTAETQYHTVWAWKQHDSTPA